VEEPRFYPYLSGQKNLQLLAAYDGGDAPTRIDDVLELVDLKPRAGDKVGGYSHGMRQRLGIAAALLRDPKLLLLDEPTTGLDPGGMRDMRAMVRRLAGEGMTVLLSSHLLGEVEELCNRVAIVRTGRIVYEGRLEELKQSAGASYRLRTTDQGLAEVIARDSGVRDVRRDGAEIWFTADEEAVARLTLTLAERGVATVALIPETVSLESLFFRLTEGEGDDIGAEREVPAEVAA
jgi:ABC-2 type transport system ATP-binding protein